MSFCNIRKPCVFKLLLKLICVLYFPIIIEYRCVTILAFIINPIMHFDDKLMHFFLILIIHIIYYKFIKPFYFPIHIHYCQWIIDDTYFHHFSFHQCNNISAVQLQTWIQLIQKVGVTNYIFYNRLNIRDEI